MPFNFYSTESLWISTDKYKVFSWKCRNPSEFLSQTSVGKGFVPRKNGFLPMVQTGGRNRNSWIKDNGRTIRDKLDGIVTYWIYRHISNANMEGFNNKIRWLTKQAYGFRDREYFKLKIYQLPDISSGKSIWTFVTNRRRGKKNGASDRIRTGDSHVGNVILYQLSYTRSLSFS